MDQITFTLPPGPAVTLASPPVSLAQGPVSFHDPAAIEAWADEDQRGFLIEFYGIVEQMPLDAVVAAIRATCQRGFGMWMEPPVGNPAHSIRPATHLIEIALFGVTGSGLTLLEAAQSWRIAARRLLEGASA